MYGCIPPGTTIWSYLDLNGISLASSDFPGPYVNVKPPTVSFSSSSYSVDEGSSATITVELSYESHALIRIPITVSNGSAESSDYTVKDLPGGRLTFSSLDTSESFTIEANQDTDDNDETVNLGFGSLCRTRCQGRVRQVVRRSQSMTTTRYLRHLRRRIWRQLLPGRPALI